MVHGRKKVEIFVSEEIINYILQSLDSFDVNIIVTFDNPLTNTIKVNNSNLFN